MAEEYDAMKNIHKSNENVKKRLEDTVQKEDYKIEDNSQKSNRDIHPAKSEEVYSKLIGEEVSMEVKGQYSGNGSGGLNFSGTYRGIVEIPPESKNLYHVLEDGKYWSNTIEWTDEEKEKSSKTFFDRQLIADEEVISFGDSRSEEDLEE
jgi:hypothetical protein